MNTKIATGIFALAVMFAWSASTQAADAGIIANGSCTPKVGDDIEVAIHTPQNNNPSIGQRSGVKYFLVTVIQGGQRAGTSIKGGKRTTLMFEHDQKELAAAVKSLGARDGAKLGMAKITAISGSFQMSKGDTLEPESSTRGVGKITISRKGKVVGSLTFKMD